MSIKTLKIMIVCLFLAICLTVGLSYALSPNLYQTESAKQPTDDTEQPDDGNLGDVDIPLPGGDDGEIEVPIDPDEDEEPDEEPEIKVLDFTFSDGVLTSYTGSETEIIIPSSYSIDSEGNFIEGDDYTVTAIADGDFDSGVFYNSSITSVQFPSTLERIGDYAFMLCNNLTSITLPSSVTELGNGSFSISNLETLEYEGTIEQWLSIDFDYWMDDNSHSFIVDGEEVTDLIIPEGIETIGISAFTGCSGIESISFPSSLKTIFGNAFNSCTGLTSIDLSDTSVDIIDYNAFWCCENLSTVVLPQYLVQINDSAFMGCTSLANISFPASLQSIGSYAFSGCTSLTNIDLSDCTYFGNLTNGVFQDCSSLTSVILPNSIYNISDTVFNNCENLQMIVINAVEVPNLGDNAFLTCSEDLVLYVPAEAVETYKTAEGWSQYADIIYADTELSIGDEETPGDDDIVEIG